jgi:drug/metabolite transporter (DMT)-like permease
MVKYFLMAFFAVFLTAIAQILLKSGANYSLAVSVKIKRYINIYTLGGYFLFFTVTLINTYAYKYLPIKYAVTVLPFTYIIVTLLSFLIFNERFTKKQKLSYLVILIGVIVYNI